MKTNTQTYLVRLYDEFTMMQISRTMPTKPTTSKGIKSQNTKIENWTKLKYPDWTEIDIIPAYEA